MGLPSENTKDAIATTNGGTLFAGRRDDHYPQGVVGLNPET